MPGLRRRALLLHVGGFLALAAGLGAAAGWLWERGVVLPTYVVGAGGGAFTSERGLTEVIGADAWFAAIGAVLGVVLGIVTWRAFGRIGWPAAVLAPVAALGAALICWWVGVRLGPGPLDPRLAAARPGDVLPIQFELRAKAALLVWPFAAALPILLAASLSRDDEPPRRLLRGARTAEPAEPAGPAGPAEPRPAAEIADPTVTEN